MVVVAINGIESANVAALWIKSPSCGKRKPVLSLPAVADLTIRFHVNLNARALRLPLTSSVHHHMRSAYFSGTRATADGENNRLVFSRDRLARFEAKQT
jgi:hypothetical protein